MVIKQAKVFTDHNKDHLAAQNIRASGEIRLAIEGLQQNPDGTFTLDGVEVKEIYFPEAAERLTEAGLTELEVDKLLGDLGKAVFNLQLTKALVGRIERV